MKKVSSGLILVIGLVAACGIWQACAAGRHAEKMRRGIRTGMTLPEVLAVTKGWIYCRGHSTSGPKTEYVRVFPNGKAEIEAEGPIVTFENPEGLSQALRQRMNQGGGDWEFTFGFLATPRRVYFSVAIGPDGKVNHISEMKTAD